MSHMSHRHFARLASATLLGGASLITLSSTAQAQAVLFSTSTELASGTKLDTGREVSIASGTVQVRLPGGAVASFVDSAQFSLRDDGSVDLRVGSVTVVGANGATVAVHMPEGVQGSVAGMSAATFTAGPSGSRGSTTAGAVSVLSNGVTKSFTAGQFWTAGANRAPDRVIAGSAAAVPSARDVVLVRPMREGGVVAAAENGVPVALGEGLAGVGASGDIVAAARRIEAYDASPTIAAFPTGDYALLVGYAAQANGLLGTGGRSFNGAGADIIRTYFEYLAAGNAGTNFRTAYAQVLLNYLDLLRSGVLPSTFRGATQAQLNAYLAFIGRTDGFGSLSAANRQLLDAYLAFLSTNGSPDAFGVSVTNLTTSFLNYVRGGGNPASFTQASATVVSQYLAIVSSGGLKTNLNAQNQALLAAYLANNGIGFTTTYATGLAAFVAYLNTGGLPSTYSALPQATIRSYLETLETTGLFDSVLGTQSAFLRSYLTFLRGGGTADQFNALPINIARVNASNLSIYVEYLLAGGAPTAYTILTQAQIRAALDQLTATGQFNALLGINAAFLSEYYAYIRTGADADTFAGLPSVDVNAYAASLQLFAAYLRAGNLPSGYSALTTQQIRSYLTALQVGGKLTLLGDNALLLGDYLTYIRTGGAPDAFGGLPIVTYTSYATALTTYFAYLNAGGLPSSYTVLTQAQLRTYLDVLKANGQFTLLGTNAAFYTSYLTYLSGGGTVDAFSGLPIVTFQGYATALTAYFAYLNAGGLPSSYTVLTQTQVRQYLDALSANAQLTALLGGNAAFFTQYRSYLLTGASADAFTGLPIVTYQSYAIALNAYYAFLVGGGSPSAYTALSQAQIRTYLDALKTAGQVNALLGANSAFFTQYLAFLETGGAANNYPGLPSSTYGQYASALSLYFTYLNNGGLPSGYTALTQVQIREYLSVLQANNQLTALLGVNATFFANYLTFVSGGGAADAFTGLPIVTYTGYASALSAYYAFLVGGGLPANYTALSQAQIRQYLDALSAAGQINALLGSNATFFTNYLTYVAAGGVPNNFSGLPSTTYGSYATALTAYFAYLNGGGLPSGYTALTQAQIREYLNVLQANNQLVALLGTNATFFTSYLTFVSGGGSADAFTGLPIVTYQSYAASLTAYYAFLAGGGLPANYTVLTQAQIRQYLDALTAANQVTALLGQNAAFFVSYQTYLAGGGAPNGFSGLPSMTYAQYGTSLQAFVAFLRGNGLPGSYTTLTSAQIREYLAVLQTNGQLGLIGSTADQQLLTNYATYLASGGVPNQFTGLPAFVTYETALRTYYAFLQSGGKPSAYSALTQAQVVAYIQALDAAGLVTTKLTADEAKFLRDYAVYVSAGNNADQFAGLPGNIPTPTPIVTQGLANAPRGSSGNLGLASAGKGLTTQASTSGNVVLTGNNVAAFSGANGVTTQSAKTVEARTVDNTIAIARLSDGTYNTQVGNTANANEGVHLVWGTPATAVPTTGLINYGLVTATQPTVDGGAVAPGTFSGNLAVNLGNRLVGWDSVIGIGGVNYRFASAGGTAAPSILLIANSNTFSGAASTANNGIAGTGGGFLSGVGGIYSGFAYTATTTIGTVEGTAIFGKGQATTTLPTVTPPPVTTTPVVTQGLANAPRGNGNGTNTLLLGAIGKTFTSSVTSDGSVAITGNNLTAWSGSVPATAADTATVEGRTVDNTIAIARWGSGTWRPETGAVRTILANEGLHFVWGAPATLLPTTGTAIFGLVTATSPTIEGGSVAPGTFLGNLGVDFGAKRIGLDSRITIGGVTYGFSTAGGTAAPSLALIGAATFNGVGTTTNVANSAGLVNGFLSGAGGVYAGLIYQAITPAGAVDGTAIFGQNQAAVTLPAVSVLGITALPAPGYAYSGGFSGSATTVYKTISLGAQRNSENNGAQVVVATDGKVSQLASLVRNGTATITDVAGNANGIVGRWTGDGKTYFVGNPTSTFTGAESLHYFAVAPATFTKPTTGLVTFSLLAATQPTYGSGYGAAGLFDAKLSVNFGTNRAGVVGTIVMPDTGGNQTYSFATTGGLASPSQDLFTYALNNLVFRAATTGAGRGCGGTCELQIQGAFGGANVNTLGIIYNTVGSNVTDAIYGAALFGGDAAVVTPNLTAPTYAYAAGLGTTNLYVRSTYPTASASGLTFQTGASVTRDSAGALLTSSNASTQDITRLTAKATDVFGDARATIGRWTDGTYRVGPTNNAALTLSTSQSLHYVQMATPSFALPTTGQINYSLLAATQPTYNTGATGAGLFDGKMALLFGSAVKVALEGTIKMPESSGTVTYSFATPGGVAGVAGLTAQTFSNNIIGVVAPLTGSGLACTTSCFLNFTGGFAGSADFNRIGAVYYTSDVRSTGPSIEGAAIFTGTAFDPNSVVVATPTRAAFTYAGGFGSSNHGYVTGESDQVSATFGTSGGSVVLSDTVETTGGVTSFGGGSIGNYARGTARQSDAAGDNIVLIGRWTGGTITAGNVSRVLGPNDSLHYALIAPGTLTLPTTGTVQYTLIGATSPTLYGGGSTSAGAAVGSGLFDAKLGVTFGSAPKVGIDGALYMPETAAGSTKYSFTTVGGAATPGFAIANLGRFQGGGVDMDATLTGSGLACPSGSCKIFFTGEMGGTNASRIGLTYATTNTTNIASISGAAAFAAATNSGAGTSFTGTLSNQVTYAYAGGSLVDQGVTTATYDAGVVKSYVSFLDGKTKSAGLVQENGRLSDVIGWARWTGDTAGPLTNQGANQGVHVMSGSITAAATLPSSGTVQYAMVGGTKTTLQSGTATPGSLTGTMAIAFGSLPRIGMDLTATVGNFGWNVKTTGGSANPTTSEVTLGANMTFTGQFNSNNKTATPTTSSSCITGCNITVGGQLFGAGASHIGVGVNVTDVGSGSTVQASVLGIFGKAP